VDPWVVVILQAGNLCISSSKTHVKNNEERFYMGPSRTNFGNGPVIEKSYNIEINIIENRIY
jgi:hypothetical protein